MFHPRKSAYTFLFLFYSSAAGNSTYIIWERRRIERVPLQTRQIQPTSISDPGPVAGPFTSTPRGNDCLPWPIITNYRPRIDQQARDWGDDELRTALNRFNLGNGES